ncbi:MAG: MarR family transcriptional regulator [Anaerolineales bacterium]|nr:MarR family transcriptional regulator [Anaerolineales bacterium]
MDSNIQSAADKFLHLMSRLRRLGPGIPPPTEAQISASLLVLLENAAESPGCGIQEMAKGLGLATPTVSIGTRQLEEAGLLERRPDPQDGRAVQLFLTPKGQELHQRTHHFRCQKIEDLLSVLSPQEQEILLGLLEKAINAAEAKNSAPAD